MSFSLEEFEARRQEYANKPAKLNPADNISISEQFSTYDAMEYEQKNSPYNQEWKALTAFGNGIKAIGKGVLKGITMLQDINTQAHREDNPDFELNPIAQAVREASDSDVLKETKVASATGLGQFGLDLASGVGQLVPSLAVAPFLGPGGSALLMGASVAGNEYDELREKGVDIDTASEAALINAGIQTPLEFIGFSKLFGKLPVGSVTKGFIKEFAERVATEGVTEFLQEYPEQITKIWAENADKSPDEILGIVKDKFGSMTADAAYSGVIGAIIGGGVAGTHMAINRDSWQNRIERNIHEGKMDIVERQIANIVETNTNPMAAADVIDANQQQSVYVDADTIVNYAQEHGVAIDDLAQSLGVETQAIKNAATEGDYIDISLGRYEAASAKHNGFFQAVKDDTAFEDGGYTVNNDKLRQEAMAKAKEEAKTMDKSVAEALQVEKDSLLTNMLTSGMSRTQANLAMELLTARAKVVNPENPAEALKTLRFQLGGNTVGLNQAMYDIRKSGATKLQHLRDRIAERKAKGLPPNKIMFTDKESGVTYYEERVTHGKNDHDLTDDDYNNIEQGLKKGMYNVYTSNWGREYGGVSSVIGKIENNGKYYVTSLEYLPNGTVVYKTAFPMDNEAAADGFIKEKGASMLSTEDSVAVSTGHPLINSSIQKMLGIVNSKYNQMAGAKAETAVLKKLNQANVMEQEGKSEAEIYNETGWFRGYDKKWRYEIPDDLNKLNLRGAEYSWQGSLEDLYKNEELFKAYPDLKFVDVYAEDLGGNIVAAVNESGDIVLNTRLFKTEKGKQKLKSSLIHEIQHIIQQKEGFASGGSLDTVVSEVSKEIANVRNKLHGAHLLIVAKYEKTFDKILDAIIDGDFDKHTRLVDEAKAMEAEIADALKVSPDEVRDLVTRQNELEKLIEKYTDMPESKESIAVEMYKALAGEREARYAEARAAGEETGNPTANGVHGFDAIYIFDGKEFHAETSLEAEKNLVAYHSIAEINLRKALELGGFPVPSIAVTTKDKGGDGFGFGDITLVGTKDLIDPAKGVPVYSGDAYTTTFPTIEHAAPKKAAVTKFLDKWDKLFSQMGEGWLSNELSAYYKSNIDKRLSDISNSATLKYYYLTEVLKQDVEVPVKKAEYQSSVLSDEVFGPKVESALNISDETKRLSALEKVLSDYYNAKLEKYEGKTSRLVLKSKKRWEDERDRTMREIPEKAKSLSTEIEETQKVNASQEKDFRELARTISSKYRDTFDSKEYSDWVNKELSELAGEDKIRLGNKLVPFNIENITKYMLKNAGGGKTNGWVYGDGDTQGAISPKFESIDAMHKASGKIAGRDEYSASKEKIKELGDRFRAVLANSVTESTHRKLDYFQFYSDVMKALGKSADSKGNTTKTKVRNALKKVWEFENGAEIPDEALEIGVEYVNAIPEAAAQYFEAKPQRIVGISEFAGAVVPEGTEQDLVDQLTAAGLRVETYDKGNNDSRQQALEKIQQEQDVLFQDNAQVKGSFNPTMQDGQYVISLFKGADASTVIHETGHYFVETMWQSIVDGQASQQVQKDFDTLLDYAGMTREQWAAADVEGRRGAHERLAEAFETYIMEGKAPSEQLKQAFKKFADWLKDVYKAISRSGNAVPLTDDVRSVFDRMLAAEEDIAEAERVNRYFANLPKVITDNMSDATKARVESFIEKARDKAVSVLTKDAMANFRDERKAEVEAYRTEILPDVEAEVAERRVYKNGYTKADVQKYRKLVQNDSGRELTVDEQMFVMQFELTAESYGYSSASEMEQDIANSPTQKQAVTRAANEKVNARFPDVMTDQKAHEEAVREALYNDDTGLLIGVEQQLIEEYANKAMESQKKREAAQQSGEKKTTAIDKTKEDMRVRAAAFRQASRNMAREAIYKLTIDDAVRTQKYATLERKAAMKSAEAMVKKDYSEALTQKNLQAYYHAMVQESILAKRLVDKNRRYLKRQVSAKREAWVSDYHFAEASMLFARMGIAQKKHDAYGRVGSSLQDYADAMNEQYDCAEFADWLLNLPDTEPLSDTKMFTLDQFNDLTNAIRNIRAIAKAEKGEKMFEKAESFDALKEDIIKNISELPEVFKPNPNSPTQATLFEKMKAAMENIDTFFERMDNWKFGFFSDTFSRRIKHSNDIEFTFKQKFDTAVVEANTAWLPDKDAKKAAAQEIYYEELGTSVNKFILTKLLMNLGNKENAIRLCETVPIGFEKGSIWVTPENSALTREQARELTHQNLLGFLGRVLDEHDVAYAQRMVNAAGLFWSEKNEMEKRVKGFGLKKVEATPQILNINGKEVVFQGGYFPLMRNGEMGSHPVSKEVGDDDPLQGKNIRTLHTNTGSTKSRMAGAKYPVNLFPGAEMQVIYDSIHDLCWRETMNDFRRVLNDGEIFAALKTHLGPARMRVFREMLEKAAQPSNTHSADFMEQTFGQVASIVRNKTANAIIMMNLKVNMQNLGNLTIYGNSVEGFTHADTIAALGNYKMNFADAEGYSNLTEFIFSKSPFMRERMEIPDISVRDVQEDVAHKQTEFEKQVMRVGTKMMAFSDGLTAKPVWLQAYQKALNNGKPEQEAVDYADMLIRRTLGSSRVTDVSSLQRGGAIFKLMTMFQSFFNTQYNQWVREYGKDKRLISEGKKREAYESAFSFFLAKYVLTCLASAALAMKNPFGTDDDDGWLEILKEMKNYTFSMFGPVGQVGSYIVGTLLGMKEYGYKMSVAQSAIEKGAKVAKTIKSDKATKADVVESVTDVAGLVLGVPAQANRMFWNLYDIIVNDMKPRLEDLTTRRSKKKRDE